MFSIKSTKHHMVWLLTLFYTFIATEFLLIAATSGPANFSGELRKWHKVTLTFDGPSSGENANPNPFTDYRLQVTFTQGSESFTVPGYFAADGNAANTGATSGNKWRAHFAPNKTGRWDYSVSFRQGSNIAIKTTNGSTANFMDGASGYFDISGSNKSAPDLRYHGRLNYVGEHYLQFEDSKEYFLKQGPDAPENFLAYDKFDGPFKTDGPVVVKDGKEKDYDDFIKSWSPHLQDWQTGDPVWQGNKGKEIIGAINYLASEDMNAFSFLTMNVGGDDRNVFPYTNYNERFRMDCSRLDQWEIVLEHANSKGMYLHFKTQETENDHLLDNGNLGNQRKLYYRELIARFSHHLALNWNLGEENTNDADQVKDFAQYFYDNDPYNHNIVIHSYPGQKNTVYDPLLGSASKLTGASLQTSKADFRNVFGDVKTWVDKSSAAGKKWVVACDEPGDASHALVPDADNPGHDNARKNALWGTFLAGGAGNEWYFGYRHDHSDLTCQDFRSRDLWWDQCRYALNFFKDNKIPFWQMKNDNSISTNSNDYCFYKANDTYIVYLKNGGTTSLNLNQSNLSYSVKWFNPRTGGSLQSGSVSKVQGGSTVALGNAPSQSGKDWVILVQKDNNETAIYNEDGGLIIMETENTKSDLDLWVNKTEISGHTGSGYLEFTGNNASSGPPKSPLTYQFKINKSGLYYLHLHCARETIDGRTDLANDAYVRVEGDYGAGPNAGNSHGDDAPLSMLKSDTKFFGGNHNKFVWASGLRLDPGGHNNKRRAIYDFKAGETYTLVVSGRSKFFKLDRIMFRHSSVSVSDAQNKNNPESDKVNDDSNDILISAFDFDDLSSGEVPYYKDNARNALAIDASVTAYRNKFARAKTLFTGKPGTYDVTITALKETDGECEYRLIVNGETIGSRINSTTNTDYAPQEHTFNDVILPANATIEVSSNAVSNDQIPEGNGFAFARGRWTNLNLEYINDVTEPENLAPVVNAGSDKEITLPTKTIQLNGSASDDGLPQGSSLQIQWSKISGPGSVSFSNGSQATTNATFSIAGEYTLELSATDGEYTSTDHVKVTVIDPNSNVVNIVTLSDAYLQGNKSYNNNMLRIENNNRTSYMMFTVSNIVGQITKATLVLTEGGDVGNGTIQVHSASHNNWSEGNLSPSNAPVETALISSFNGAVNGQQKVNFDVTAWVNQLGTYTFIVKMIDGNDVAFSSKEGNNPPQLIIESELPINQAPVVDAGSDTTLEFPELSTSLSGSVQDDGLPFGSVVSTWSKVSGPGDVSFADQSSASTTATFSEAGTYVLTLSAEDGELSSNDTVTITINPADISVTRLVLIDADTDLDIKILEDGDSINTAVYGSNLNIRADVDGPVESVRFNLNDIKKTENWAPYAIFGDTSGDYNVWPDPVGEYSLTATPFYENKAKGAAGIAKSIQMGITTAELPYQTVVQLILVNASTNEEIRPLYHGAEISLSEVGTELNVVARVGDGVESVVFDLNGQVNFQTENVAPYALVGDVSGDYKIWTPSLGEQTIVATPYSADKANGAMGLSLEIVFTIIE